MSTPTDLAVVKQRLDSIEHLVKASFNLINYWSSKIMSEVDTAAQNVLNLSKELKAKADADAAQAAVDRAEAEKLRGMVDNAVGLLQALTAKIADLQGQLANAGVTDPATLAALNEAQTLLAGVNTALTTSAADDAAQAAALSTADATLASGVTANTPAP